EPVVLEPQPDPVAAAAAAPEIVPELEPAVAAEAPAVPETHAVPEAPTPAVEPAELPIAAAATAPAAGIEPIPTAVGQPVPASVIDGPLSWPEPVSAAAPFEPAWPDETASRRRAGANLPAITQPAAPLAAHACPGCGLSLSASARFC